MLFFLLLHRTVRIIKIEIEKDGGAETRAGEA
jgi:hypothetical protein